MKLFNAASFKYLGPRLIMGSIIVSGLLIALTFGVQFWYSNKLLRSNNIERASYDLQLKSMSIKNVLTSVETAINNSVPLIEERIAQPDSIFSILHRVVDSNPWMIGSSASFKAGFYPRYGRWCEFYVSKRPDGTFRHLQLGSPVHDYLNSEWFLAGMKANDGHWSEPYYDPDGADMLLCTYSLPIRDKHGQTVGLFNADIPLDWLSKQINEHPLYPSSYHFMLSREGLLIAHPNENLVMKSVLKENDMMNQDPNYHHIHIQMVEGESGYAVINDKHGEERYIFYQPIGNHTGWSMASNIKAEEVFAPFFRQSLRLLAILLTGALALVYIVWHSLRSMFRLQDTENEQATIENELTIASHIQNSLLPKQFPPFPERDDVDLRAFIMPAKEVGGDLYDFYIRDEKLFFCIGDVSGKGVPASLVMTITLTLFRSASAHEAQPHRIVCAINEAMADDDDTEFFVTLFLGVLDLPTGLLRYCNAGHNVPVLIGDKVEPLPVQRNLPIGALPDWNYTMQETTIKPGELLFFYTDGITEAMDASHHLFGKQRMMDVLRTSLSSLHSPLSTLPSPLSSLLLQQMESAVCNFVGNAKQSDDIAMLVVSYTKTVLPDRLHRHLTLPSSIDAIPQLSSFVMDVCQQVWGDPLADDTLAQPEEERNKAPGQVHLAVEEAVANVIKHSYEPGSHGVIDIDATANDKFLRFVITDSGNPFDPTSWPKVYVDTPSDDRPIGGLGIHLMRHLMTAINYNRIDNKNVLTLIKRIENKNPNTENQTT